MARTTGGSTGLRRSMKPRRAGEVASERARERIAQAFIAAHNAYVRRKGKPALGLGRVARAVSNRNAAEFNAHYERGYRRDAAAARLSAARRKRRVPER